VHTHAEWSELDTELALQVVQVVVVPGAAPLPAVEYDPSGHALQLATDPREYLPATHGVHGREPDRLTPAACAKPPAAE